MILNWNNLFFLQCSVSMTVEVEEGKIRSLEVQGGCSGNLTGISRLVVGMPVTEVIARLEGIPRGEKTTSCPDQLAKGLKKKLQENN